MPNEVKKITANEVAALIEANRAVFPYPRKGIIVVDGFKRYTATPAVIAFTKEKLASVT